MLADMRASNNGQRGAGFAALVTLLTAAALFLSSPAALAQDGDQAAAPPDSLPPLTAPTIIEAYDTPNDRGNSININWEPSPTLEADRLEYYRVERAPSPDGEFVLAGRSGPLQTSYRDSEAPNREPVYYRVVAVGQDGREGVSETYGPVEAYRHWFNTDRINVMIAVIFFVIAIVYFVNAAKTGKELFIRRLAGLDEMDNAVGRATEMGKPILYISGLSTISDVATIAAINILGEVAQKTAEYNTKLIVPCADPIVMAVEQEVVREAYAKAGRPDAYNEDDVYYLTRSQFAYVAGVNGIMVRQRPATILYMGMFFAESLLLAETGASVGSIQIAGTDAVTQLPFFITSCDYTLIGEELYAASAYLSREPVLLGGLKGQDAVKFVAGVFLIIGVISATLVAAGAIDVDFAASWFVTG